MADGERPFPSPGWYPEPGNPDVSRWWTGRDWSEYRRSSTDAPQPAQQRQLRPDSGLSAAGRPACPRRVGVGEILAVLLLGLLALVGTVSAGVSGLLMWLGIGAIGVSLYALIRGRSKVFRLRSRLAAVGVLGVAFAVLAAGSAAYGAQHPGLNSAATVAAPASQSAKATAASRTAVPRSAASAAPSLAPDSALAILATLPVKGKSPLTGYARTEDFGAAWLDVEGNGCDTRDDILKRDLTGITTQGCKVETGVLKDPYSGGVINFTRGVATSSAVQIDHVVSLADAWQTGAQQLSVGQRVDLANDPINLFAVDGPTNEAKGDGDAATWLPAAKSFRCEYVAHQVGVKAAYYLWVTAAEKAAMQRVLSACPAVKAPISVTADLLPAVNVASSPTSSPTPSPKPKPLVSKASVYYANCDAVRAAGKAPLDRGSAGYRSALDRDGDGIACESSSSSSSSSSSGGSSSSGSSSSNSSAPAGATAICRDGTYSYSQHHSGTCSHHGGVQDWL